MGAWRIAATAAFAAALAGCGAAKAPVERVEWTAMGTVAALQCRGSCDPRATETVKRVFADVERLLSAHDPASELSRLAPLPDEEVLARCDPLVRPCYEAAFRLMRETGGAFSPRWRGPGTLDLGAIAKGFAADLAAERLRAGGLASADMLVDLGGNLKAVSGEWTAGVYAPPGADAPPEAIRLAPGSACATSGEYARGRHIRDGRTGRAVDGGPVSVTVVHPASATLADGLSTVMFVLGREKGEVFLRSFHPEARAVWYW